VWVGVLGSLEVRRLGDPVHVGGPGPRCLLALLALRGGAVVSREEMVDVLWGAAPPSAHLTQLRLYVAVLRRLLEPGSDRRSGFRTLVHDGAGYRLVLPPEASDLGAFQLAYGRAHADQAGRPPTVDTWRAMLDCWRGPLLGGADYRLAEHPAAVAITARRVEAALAYAGQAERDGCLEAACAHLQQVAADQPLHEALHAWLMLALAAAGRQADALHVFDAMRRRLDSRLGIEPGAHLRAAHLRVLRQQIPGASAVTSVGLTDPARAHRWTNPAQLPGAGAGIVGRGAALRWLDGQLPNHKGATGRLVVLSGTAGVGKTATAVHWAHRVRRHFPDGQLFVSLRGWGTGAPLRPAEALAGTLRSLGMAGADIPATVEEASAVYRALLADRRVLVLLDDARDADQLRPLLPGGPYSLALVTSRDRLSGLVAGEGAARLVLDPLSSGDTEELLAESLGAERVAAEPNATAELGRRCAHLPLALRIAAAHLLDSPGLGIGDYVTLLANGTRLDELAIPGNQRLAVRTAFDASYTRLDPEAQRLFRLLGVVPAPDVSAGAAAALLDATPAVTRRALHRLVAACLVDEPTPHRYTSHDLLREYAADRSASEDSHHERCAALQRYYDHHLAHALAAAATLHPSLLRLPPPVGRPAPPAVRFDSEHAALTWLDSEHACSTAIVAHTARHGPRPVAWRLADALRGYLNSRMYTTDWRTVADAGLHAATAEDDPAGLAAAHLNQSTYHWYQGDYLPALGHQTSLLRLAEQLDWTEARAAALANLGTLFAMLGDLDRATDHLERGLRVRRGTGDRTGQITALNNLGYVALQRGLLDEAVQRCGEALVLARRIRSRNDEADCLRHLGLAHYEQGRLDTAAQRLGRAWRLYEETGEQTGRAEALAGLALVDAEAGDGDRARAVAEKALVLAQDIGSPITLAIAFIAAAVAQRPLGRAGRALEYNRCAVRLTRDVGYHYVEQEALLCLAQTLHRLGRAQEAVLPATTALTAARTAGYRLLERQAQILLAACSGTVKGSV
jgi:DNA-binding SARP family transcriptional activator/tetratricopeptide (TPR) repeat protein